MLTSLSPRRASGQVALRVSTYVSITAVLLILSFIIGRQDWEVSGVLASATAAATTLVAFVVGVLSLLYYRTTRNSVALFTGTGFLGASILHAFHTLVAHGLLSVKLARTAGGALSWSWTASELFLGVMLLLGFVFWVYQERGRGSATRAHLVYIVGGLLTLGILLILTTAPLPRAHFPELAVHRPQELLPALFMGLAIIGYLYKGDWRYDRFEHWLIISLIFLFMSQAAFMAFSVRPFDAMYTFGSSPMPIAYLAVFIGLLFGLSDRFAHASPPGEEPYRTVFDDVPLGLFRTTPGGRIIEANAAIVEMLGFKSRGELLASESPDLWADVNDRKHWKQQLEREGVLHNFETRLKSVNGEIIPVLLSARVVRDILGRIICYEGAVEHVGERWRRQELTNKTTRMEVVSRLAGGMAHDFNNLLTVILVNSQSALAELEEDDPKRLKLQEILEASQRAAALTHQLLAFSRKQALQPSVIDLNDALAEMEPRIRATLRENVELSIIREKAGLIDVDPVQLEQIVVNLVANAQDAMPGGGTLRIETGGKALDESHGDEITEVKAGGYVMLRFADTGHGMDQRTLARVFEPFFSTRSEDKRAGLGLSTVYGTVKQSGGYIWMSSEAGVGTTVEIYFPEAEEAAEAPPATSPAEPNEPLPSSPIILVVEDDDAVRNVLGRALQRAGYNVLSAGNSTQALQISAQHDGPIHLIVSDVVMPKMKGPELAERIRRDRPTTKLLLISGYTDPGVENPSGIDAATPFLQKPFTPEALVNTVEEVLGRDIPGAGGGRRRIDP